MKSLKEAYAEAVKIVDTFPDADSATWTAWVDARAEAAHVDAMTRKECPEHHSFLCPCL